MECHTCQWNGKNAGTEYASSPCARCGAGEGFPIQGHGRVVSLDSYAGGVADTAAEVDAVEAEAAAVVETRDAEAVAADADALAEKVAAVVYSVACLSLGELVAVWNLLRGGRLADAGDALGVTKQRAGRLLRSGLVRLGVEDLFKNHRPARRKLFEVRRRARAAAKVRGLNRNPRRGLAVEAIDGPGAEIGQKEAARLQ